MNTTVCDVLFIYNAHCQLPVWLSACLAGISDEKIQLVISALSVISVCSSDGGPCFNNCCKVSNEAVMTLWSVWLT